jgi:hypothetical protein
MYLREIRIDVQITDTIRAEYTQRLFANADFGMRLAPTSPWKPDARCDGSMQVATPTTTPATLACDIFLSCTNSPTRV